MKRFATIMEQKNTHMEHLEDIVFDGGVDGARQSIQFLIKLRDSLSGYSKQKINATIKWDGAPAIFVGKDPSDGQFFVAKKGIFNKTPKVYKTDAEVDADTSGDLSVKLKTALKKLKGMQFDGVLQGDFLYTASDLKTATVGGVKYITFHPNTIVYAVPYNSSLGKRIRNSSMGVVWHTAYSGRSFESMSASYGGINVKKLDNIRDVFMADADFNDVSGNALMTADETKAVTQALSKAGKAFRKVNARSLNLIANNSDLNGLLKVYQNRLIKTKGVMIKNPNAHAKGLINYLLDYEKKELAKRKTDRGKGQFALKFKPVKEWMANTAPSQIAAMYALQMYIVEAKLLIINKMNQASKLKTFLKTNKGWRITGEEGYVAIDRISGAVKLVDRLEFSYANFSPDVIKGWQTDLRR